MKTVEWEIVQGLRKIYVLTRDEWDIGYNNRGRQYSISLLTLRRIAKVIHNFCDIELIPDGFSLIIRAKRKQVTP